MAQGRPCGCDRTQCGGWCDGEPPEVWQLSVPAATYDSNTSGGGGLECTELECDERTGDFTLTRSSTPASDWFTGLGAYPEQGSCVWVGEEFEACANYEDPLGPDPPVVVNATWQYIAQVHPGIGEGDYDLVVYLIRDGGMSFTWHAWSIDVSELTCAEDLEGLVYDALYSGGTTDFGCELDDTQTLDLLIPP